MRLPSIISLIAILFNLSCQFSYGQDGSKIIIRESGKNGIRITIDQSESLHEPLFKAPYDQITGDFRVELKPSPLSLTISKTNGQILQEIVFASDGKVRFKLDDSPILGLGEGGPRVTGDWRNQKIEFDRRGRYHYMQPRWQANAYGSRNPVPLLIGTGGWAIYVAAPWVEIDMQKPGYGYFIPREQEDSLARQQNQGDQQRNLGKGLPAAGKYAKGYFDLYFFDTSDPASFMKDISDLAGPAVIPPKWALGYMQSHRTLEDDRQLLDIVDSFREKKLPIDAVIYLGTGFCPQGWNTKQPSFDFNPEVFKRDPEKVLADLHARNVKTVVHIVPWDRDKLPTLYGNIPSRRGEIIADGHIAKYWQEHINLLNTGVDAFWPDEGDWFNLDERIKRHQLYYEGPLASKPNTRPWSLHRNGYLGIAQWGGWVWSGDTESSWKTLEGQIAVGINHSLSLSPYWGSDIGGFYPNEELSGELYARWFQFGAFCPSFRSHGRTWWTRLPWGWGLDDLGPIENRDNPLKSELNNPEIEEICRKYSELRYQLMPYNYTLAWEARETGMPLMRSLWLHYPTDKIARQTADQYLWGRDILVAPVYQKGADYREIYLPAGDWYDWWTDERITGGRIIEREVDLSIMPVYIKAGSIIPVDPVRQYVDEEVDEPLAIRIYAGADGKYSLYEDDGISQEYLQGKSNTTVFEWNDKNEILTIKPGLLQAKPWSSERKFKIELVAKGKDKIVNFDGKAISVKF